MHLYYLWLTRQVTSATSNKKHRAKTLRGTNENL
ncbi:hypothetical protein MXMO3_00575 [Maritalea myrionectae]|uniref:Uncharacterized protein n=1 Tax=Maritalea myrionectae TaxID=454601 RepID=A0A2R4MB77_9HYPH|nr:hypothetical protein MXMO3_00575 [Maritalea myrionectae]